MTRASGSNPVMRGQLCDFCGAEVESVRRVALDRDYDRLRPPHRERYACPECSERKERQRVGLDSKGLGRRPAFG